MSPSLADCVVKVADILAADVEVYLPPVLDEGWSGIHPAPGEVIVIERRVLVRITGRGAAVPGVICGELAEDARGNTASCTYLPGHDGHCSWWTL